MADQLSPTLQHELSSPRNDYLPDFGILKKQCITFGDGIPLPVDSINQIAGYESAYLHKIHQLKLNIPTPIQAHLWPILFRGRSATCISAPKSGKTLSYLIPALSQTQFVEGDPDKIVYGDEGPKVIAVCSGMNKVYEIRDQIYSIVDTSNTVRVICLTKDNENAVITRILNGCDILIATPGSLNRLIANASVRFDTCFLLVFDDADRSFTLQPELVQAIVLEYLKSYKKRLNISDDVDVACLLTAPMLILADSWTKEVKNFSTKYTSYSTQIFGDLFEAAISHSIDYRITYTADESQRLRHCADLIHSILNRGFLKRIAIVCSNDAEIAQVSKAMNDLDVTSVIIDGTKSHFHLDKLIGMSKNLDRAITIITDDKIKELAQINYIEVLVHYSMPDHSDIFRCRFMLMSTLIKKNDPSIATYFILSPINDNHANFLNQTLRRIGETPAELENLANISQRPLCDYYLAYSYCPFESTFCLNRHQFKLTDSANKSLPIDGQIRFEITHIITANQFYIRLIEYRDSTREDGTWSPFMYQYKEIKDALMTLKDATPSIEEKVPIIGKIYGLNVMGNVHRVKVIKNSGQLDFAETNAPIDENTPYKLEVDFIDFGYHSKAFSHQLISLPKHLRDYPVLARRSYILGIKPTDNEIEWTHKPAESLTKFLRENNDSVGTAWIRLQRNSIFWLHGMRIIQNLKHMKRNVISWSPQSDLINYQLADKNDKLFNDVNTNHHELHLKWHNIQQSKLTAQSFLSDHYEYTYLTHFVDLKHFYVAKESSFKCLEDLEKELSKCNLTPMKAFIPNCFGVGILKSGDRTCYSRIKILKYSPKGGKVEVFFLDWGETLDIAETDCFIIEDKFIKRMPFQAIKCSLIGVDGEIDANRIYDLTRNPDELFKTVLVQKVAGTKEDGYSVRVYYHVQESKVETEFHRLSKWLVDNEGCNLNDEEEEKQEEKITIQKMVDNDEEDTDTEDEDEGVKGDRRCAENMLRNLSKGLREILLKGMTPDPVQFDPKKISTKRRLIMNLRRRQEEQRTENDDDDDGDDDDLLDRFPHSNRSADGSLLPPPTDFSNVHPIDPATDSDLNSDSSELESDIEELADFD